MRSVIDVDRALDPVSGALSGRSEGIATPGSTRRSPFANQLMVKGADAATLYGVVLFLFNWTR